MMVMVGIAAAVAMSTQEDLSVSGQDREAKAAFYAAEYAVAQGKDYLAGAPYDGVTGWTALLKSGAVQLCKTAGGAVPGVVPNSPITPFNPNFLVGVDAVQYNFCIHNNNDNPAYVTATGDLDDSKDASHYLVIEGYGYYGANKATAHVAATVGSPVTTPIGSATDYSVEGGVAQHSGNGGSMEAGIAVNTSIAKGL